NGIRVEKSHSILATPARALGAHQNGPAFAQNYGPRKCAGASMGRSLHLCEPTFHHATPIPLALLGALAVGLRVLGVLPPIGLPIPAILSCPGALCSCLIILVVGISLPLGTLPAPPPHASTLFFPTILLIANSRTRTNALAASGTPPPIHPCVSAQ